MENKYVIKDRLTSFDSSHLDLLKANQKVKLLEKLVSELPERDWAVIRLRTNFKKDQNGFYELSTALETKQVIEQTPAVIAHPMYYKVEHKGFIQKLKLLFSKKTVYTEE